MSIEYYSQIGQDKIVDEIFRGMNYGYFVDIGAANGIEISNTYALEKHRNWSGLCIEPNKSFFEELKANRKCAVDNSFILRDGVEVEYTEFLDGGNRYFSGAVPDKYRVERSECLREVNTRQAVSLHTLLEKHKAPTVIHFMSIDTEGSEYDILEDYFKREYENSATQFFTRYPLVIAVEHNNKEPARTSINTLLSSYNYILHKTVFQDDIYVHRAIDILL